MENSLTFILLGGKTLASIPAEAPRLADSQAVRELMANAYHQGADGLLLPGGILPEGFFDLKTRMAGEILQAFSNYRLRLAVILDRVPESGSTLAAFVTESNRGQLIRFVMDPEEGLKFLEH